MTLPSQPGILEDVPALARYLTFHSRPDSDLRGVLERLGERDLDASTVVGFGRSLVQALGGELEGLRVFPQHTAAGIDVPSTPGALWVWLRGNDRGVLVHRTRELTALLHEAFYADPPVDSFKYDSGRDLSGYEDGTENPVGDDATAAAFVAQGREGTVGGSFVSVQKWVHDLSHFETLPTEEQDHIIGRRRSDNEELDDAPASAHVKRTAQESFTPEAFMLRRSMPWADGNGEGLVFVSFCHTLDAYEAQLARMCGDDDDVTDALFRFSHPVTGAHFFCPPVREGKLDLRALFAG